MLVIIREWADALVIAFVLAMFVRVFIVELFKIPTGSMSPTLIGDYVADVDWDQDGDIDLVVHGSQTLVFLKDGDRFIRADDAHVTAAQLERWRAEGVLKPEYDRILVNKFSYWFEPIDRGDVVVFKVPEAMWKPTKPIYIKRAVGLPGDRISFQGKLEANGEIVTEPEFFQKWLYDHKVNSRSSGFAKHDYVRYSEDGFYNVSIEEVDVPVDGLYVLGDNTKSSLDSRYWGIVPLDNVKGKAFLRYWPFNKIKFIK